MTSPIHERAELANNHTYWLSKARDLHAAAGALWYCMQNNEAQRIAPSIGLGEAVDMTAATWRVYRMLCGMALELAYKALAVLQRKPVLTVHDLVQLAQHAGVPLLKAKDVRLLHLLTECIVWDGRYPVPKSNDSLEYFAYLTYETLYRKERDGTSVVLKPVEPDPLDWDQFQEFWDQAMAGVEWHAE